MTRFEGSLDTHFGTYYPTGYVVAVVDDRDQANRAVQALRSAGVPTDQVRVMSGDEVLAIDREFKESQSFGQRLGGMLAADEGEAVQQYVEAAQRGHALVTVPAPELAEAQRINGVLAEHGAHGVRHYGRLMMSVLTPPRHG